jgi:2-dehydro-3-deoxy-D-arabinonate dehydratase
MRYYRTGDAGDPRLVAVADGEDGPAYDLTAANPSLTGFGDLAHVAHVAGQAIDDLARRLREEATSVPVPTDADATVPVVADEVWAAGVTYRISEEAREAESGVPDLYLDVYEADRPELFFKSTGDRVVGPGEAVGIRADSDWTVPEPELGVVLIHGEVAGFTVGNDVSSRSIEGANPLYLPQAKTYDRACALGPCVATAETVGDPLDTAMRLEIRRDGESIYRGRATTADLVRSPAELTSYLTRHYTLPERAVLLTGTSIVPDEDVSLAPGDVVDIDVDGIGRLRCPATLV